MPPVVAAIVTVVAVYGWAVAVTAVVMAASIAYAAYAMSNMPDMPGYSSEVRGRTQVVRSAVAPHRVVYGTCMVSGPLVASFSTGSDNKFIYLVIVLASHEVAEIGDIYLGDRRSDDGFFTWPLPDATPASDIWPASDALGYEKFTLSGSAVTLQYRPFFEQVYVKTVVVDPPSTTISLIDPIHYTTSNRTITFDETVAAGSDIRVLYRGSRVEINKHLGAMNQAVDDDLLANAVDSDGNKVWTSAHTLSGRAYIVVRLTYSTACFPQGIPNIKAVVRGACNIYDPRTATTGWTDNSALCLRDYITASYGLSCPATDINEASFIAAANLCDESVAVKTGTGTGYTTDTSGYAAGVREIKLITGTGTILAGDTVHITTINGSDSFLVERALDSLGVITLAVPLSIDIPASACTVSIVSPRYENRYTCNGAFTLDQKPMDIIKKLLTSCAGRLVWSQGYYSLVPGSYSYPVQHLTEDDLRDSITLSPAPSRRQRTNTVRGTYVSPADYWQQVDFPMVRDASGFAADGHYELVQNLELPYTTTASMAQRLASIFLRQLQYACQVEFPAKLTAFLLQPGDVVTLTLGQLGWDQKPFRVLAWKVAENGGIDLSLREESPDIYTWTSDLESTITPPPAVYVPSVSSIRSPVSVTGVEQVVTVPNGSVTRTDYTLTWSSGDSLTTSYIVQLNGVDYATTTGTSYTFQNLLTGTYTFGVIAINTAGVKSTTTTITDTITIDSLISPSLVYTDEGDHKKKVLYLLNNEIRIREV